MLPCIPKLRWPRPAALLCALAACVPFAAGSPARAASSTSGTQMCAYPYNSIAALNDFASDIGRSSINCALVYGESASWSAWSDPWYLSNGNDASFAEWVRAAPSGQPRTLLISMPLISDSQDSDPSWRAEGAAGDFSSYDITLAQNLVNAGLGQSIIDLGPEANGSWEPDYIGTTSQTMADWVSTWRNTVLAMRSVPGADFTFVWAVNNREPAIPFADYYPGNDVVNVIGDDVYDEVLTNGSGWTWSDGGAEGLASLISFAKANDKPIAFPEWASGIPNSTSTSDDPGFMQGMINTIQTQDVAFQSYFFARNFATGLLSSPQSFSLFASAFGNLATATAATTPSSAGAGSTTSSPVASTTTVTAPTSTKVASGGSKATTTVTAPTSTKVASGGSKATTTVTAPTSTKVASGAPKTTAKVTASASTKAVPGATKTHASSAAGARRIARRRRRRRVRRRERGHGRPGSRDGGRS
jgi:hypothetical protein